MQALGMSAGPVLARSIVRDLYSWDNAARTLALMSIVLGIAPILGPLLGKDHVVKDLLDAVLSQAVQVLRHLDQKRVRLLPEPGRRQGGA